MEVIKGWNGFQTSMHEMQQGSYGAKKTRREEFQRIYQPNRGYKELIEWIMSEINSKNE